MPRIFQVAAMLLLLGATSLLGQEPAGETAGELRWLPHWQGEIDSPERAQAIEAALDAMLPSERMHVPQERVPKTSLHVRDDGTIWAPNRFPDVAEDFTPLLDENGDPIVGEHQVELDSVANEMPFRMSRFARISLTAADPEQHRGICRQILEEIYRSGIFVCIFAASETELPPAYEPLQGAWEVLGDGAEAQFTPQWTFTGRRIEWDIPLHAKLLTEGEFTLDDSVSPSHIDIHTGPGRISLGIYRLEGDTLTLCIAPRGTEELPTEFVADEEKAFRLIELQRAALAEGE